jgi:hypothetical protein
VRLHYRRSWFDEKRMPLDVYTSAELAHFEKALFALLSQLVAFKHRVLPTARA